ncbi:MAG: membrane protein insertion efficiency factor YidD [Chlamydiae bacterium]|nr:membrane protein insertion efficiency factor YidD [Chlamydiota bacterium]
MKKIFVFIITLYQWLISPLLGNCCRFYPTCSEYCKEAIQKHGILRGMWMGSKRICKCQPWHPGGIDEVP